MTLLVIGGTGTLGLQIVRKALEEGFQVKCLVRNRTNTTFLKELGAKLVYGDLSMCETLPLCFKEITAVIDASTTRADDINTINEIDLNGKLALIKISQLVGIKRFIFFSILNAEKYPDIPIMQMKKEIEETLKTSGIPYTIFKVAGFYQAIINQYAIPLLDKQPLWVTKESVPISYIDTQDVASICLKSLLNKHTENETFFLGGPKPWISKNIIEVCENLSGQKAQLKFIPISFLKFAGKINRFFDWSLKITERLAFVKILEEKEFSSNSKLLYEIFDLNVNDFLKLENYLEEYFERMLNTLKDLKYEQTFKQRDLKV